MSECTHDAGLRVDGRCPECARLAEEQRARADEDANQYIDRIRESPINGDAWWGGWGW